MERRAKTSLRAVAGNLPANVRHGDLPEIVACAGDAARFAWDEFFRAEIRNPHTRKAYAQAVRQFLEWPDVRGVALHAITPAMVGDYLDQLDVGPTTKKLHLAGLRKFFDRLVLRHVIILNPAASVQRAHSLHGLAFFRACIGPPHRGTFRSDSIFLELTPCIDVLNFQQREAAPFDM